jgi:hypothetical protein
LGDALALGAPQVLHGNLTYSNCEMVGTPCEIKEVSRGGLFEFLRTAVELGEVKGTFEVSLGPISVDGCQPGRVRLLESGQATGQL